METKKTAVDFLLHEMSKIIQVVAPDSFNATLLRIVYEEAKSIEKEQLIDFYIEGCNDPYYYQANKMNAETYFDKNFKNN